MFYKSFDIARSQNISKYGIEYTYIYIAHVLFVISDKVHKNT